MPSELSKAYDPAAVQSEVAGVWDAERCFHAEPTDAGEPYSIVIPPPNVTAALHLGHALNNTIQDILIRRARMQGKNAVWLPGTDHAGIATQTVVEKRVLKEEGKRRTEFARDEFVGKIQAWKDEYEQVILGQLKSMGCSCDFERTAFTMDEPRAKAVREAFFQLFKAGLIYRGKRLVNWDPVTQTALADDEVENEEVDGFFYYLRYPLCDHDGSPAKAHAMPGVGAEDVTHVTVATTRPETMLGDTAIAVNPTDPRAASLKGLFVKLPIVGRIIPIIEDDYVVKPVQYGGDPADNKAQMATGFLKVTPAHDPNDYDIGRRHNLPVINVMAPDGSISDKFGWTDGIGDAAFLLGKSRETAREEVVEWFRRNELLEDVKPYRHSVGHSYRSHVPIEPYLSDQWYCRVTDDRLAGAALRAMSAEQRSATSRDREGATANSTPAVSLTYFITFTSYGTWLHGDEKGSVHPIQNVLGTPVITGDLVKEQSDFDRLKHDPFTLNETAREAVQAAILEVAQHRGWALHALHVRTNHVHAVVTADRSPERVMNDFKSYATRRLKAESIVTDVDRIWTRHGSTRYLNYPKSVEAAVEYVVNEQGPALSPAPIDERRGALPNGRGSLPASLTFYPARYAKTYQTWHENIRDWCISRQLWWGHRIPVWSRSKWDGENYTEQAVRNYFRQFVVLPACGNDAAKAEEAMNGIAFLYTDTDLHVCLRGGEFDGPIIEMMTGSMGYSQDPDVLDTWFSSGLWPMSTLGWPDNMVAEATMPHDGDTNSDNRKSQIANRKSPALAKWNPTTVLTTAREIITLWVSRMVMFNEFFLGQSPFKDVFIHAMIQDGHGQKMSKTLGNGVNPLDIIASHGADAMRFTLASMCTQTQDVRMPVTVIDPYTNEPAEPKWTMTASGHVVMEPQLLSGNDPKKPFWTSYGQATGFADKSPHPVARNTSPKFDLGRNFANKLWNASRFALSQIAQTQQDAQNPASSLGAAFDEKHLTTADKWILSRLNRTIRTVDDAMNNYRFDQYAMACYDFFWGDFCNWYVENAKPQMKDPARRGTTAAVLAATVDASLRLLHPAIPFVTEKLWWALNELTPDRSLPGRLTLPPGERLIKSAWPTPGATDESAEAAYAIVQDVVTQLRNLRSTYNVDPKKVITVAARCPADVATVLRELQPAIEMLSTASLTAVGPDVAEPGGATKAVAGPVEMFVADLYDAAAEAQRKAKLRDEKTRAIAALEGRLGNAGYLAKAPPHLVKQTQDQLAAAKAELAALG